MSSLTLESRPCVPVSFVKCPGTLFKDKRPPYEIKVTQKRIQNLLEHFQSSSRFSQASESNNFFSGQYESLNLSTRPGKSLKSLMNSHSSQEEKSPGKLKTSIEDMASIIKKAREILSFYGIKLIFQDIENTRGLQDFLKQLLPELCFFTSDFFQKIKVDQIVISSIENSDTFMDKNTIFLCFPVYNTLPKLCERLYKLIFSQIISVNPEILKKWALIESRNGDKAEGMSSEDYFLKMAEVFVALMTNSTRAILKSRMRNLRELLEFYYPETMSKEQFDNKNKENKTPHVSFICQEGQSI